MTPEEQVAVAQLMNLNYTVTPIQVGDQIRVLLQIATAVGVTTQYNLSQDAARALSKAIKDGVQQAEVTLVKPQGLVASA